MYRDEIGPPIRSITVTAKNDGGTPHRIQMEEDVDDIFYGDTFQRGIITSREVIFGGFDSRWVVTVKFADGLELTWE